MVFYRLAAAAAIIWAATAAGPATADVRDGQYYSSVSPNELLSILTDEGGVLEVDETQGDTTLEGRVDGKTTSVYFYDCDGAGFTAPATPNSACLGYEFRAYFEGYPKDSDTINQFNAEYHYGKLWRDSDDDLALNFTVLVEGGVTRSHIVASYKWWRDILEDFDNFMASR